MNRADHHRGAEIAVAWWVAVGVGSAGIYDFHAGRAPAGLLGLGEGAAQALLLVACVATALLGTLAARGDSRHRNVLRRVLLLTSGVPSLVADPTYGCLLVAVPLMDVRRRDAPPVRTVLSALILGTVAILLLTEGTPRIIQEIEAMIGIGVAFLVIVMLGDAFRQLDAGIAIRTSLARLAERMRVAEDLHDGVGHHLLAASVQLQKAAALRTRDTEGSDRSVDLARQAIADAVAETRLVVDATRDDRPAFDLEASIRDAVDRLSSDGPNVAIDLQGDHDALDRVTRLTLYRVVQEALSNLVRHAAATRADVVVRVSDEVTTLVLADDGQGFDRDDVRASGGLRNMVRRIEELGGTLDVDSAPGRTVITVTLPR